MFLQVSDDLFIQTHEIERIHKCGKNNVWVYFRSGKQLNISINIHKFVELIEAAGGEYVVRDKSFFIDE